MTYVWQHAKWPKNLEWDANELLNAVAQASGIQGKILATLQAAGLDLEQERHALEEEAITTSAIEGEKLNRDSVRSSVARRLGLDLVGPSAPVPREIDGLIEVLTDATHSLSSPLTAERLWGWHAALFPTGYSSTQRIRIGGWREGKSAMQVVSGRPGHETVHFEAPPSARVHQEMQDFLAWYNQPDPKLNGLLRAGIAHFWFVTIHPFDDGNGRIARALTDRALAQNDGHEKRYYSFSAEIREDRLGYYEHLQKCQCQDGDLTSWLLWFLQTFAKAMARCEDILQTSLLRTAFWASHENTELNARQRKVLFKMVGGALHSKGSLSEYEGGMTKRKYEAIAKTSSATATRDLKDLEAKGILLQGPARGRGTFYELIWPKRS